MLLQHTRTEVTFASAKKPLLDKHITNHNNESSNDMHISKGAREKSSLSSVISQNK